MNAQVGMMKLNVLECIQCIPSPPVKKETVNFALGNKNTTMLLDTGSAVSVVSDKYYQTHLTHFPIKPARVLLRPKHHCSWKYYVPRDSPDNTAEEGSIFYFSHGEEPPIVAKDTEKATMKDPVLSKVWSYTMNGWLSYMQDKPYFIRRQDLSSEQGCILWGQRVIISPVYQQKVMEDLHHEHPAIL